jgi:dihydroorotate dehydrogenase
MIAWRKAGAWDHAILAIGGITTIERARDLLNEGASAVLVDTAAIFDPLFAVRFRNMMGVAPRPVAKPAPIPARKVAAR